MSKKYSFLLAALALVGCATSQDQIVRLPSYAPAGHGAERFIANDCNPKPCAYVDNVNDGHMTIVGKGFEGNQSRYQVGIYFNGSFDRTVMTDNGSFSYTTTELPAGTNVKIQVNDFKGPGQHLVRSFTVPKHDTGGNNGGNSGGNSGGQQPPPPEEYRMPRDQLVRYADQQARTVANRVVATYGALENWKYNFTMGYWEGADEYHRSGAGSSQASIGAAHGGPAGARDGYQAGVSSGSGSGKSSGEANARERFRAILNTGNAPDTAIGSIAVPIFGGVSAGAACNTAGEYGTTLENRLSSELRVIRFGNDEYGYLVYDATVYSLTFSEINTWGAGKYEFADSWFRTDYAWNEWFNNDLGGRYDKTNYRKLAYDQQQDFQSVFKSVYDSVIDEKFFRKKTDFNAGARSRGQYYGMELAKKQAYDSGCNAAYAATYVPASIRGFADSYAGGYRSGFASTVQYYNTHPVISIDGIKLVDGNENGVYELGESLGVQVGSYSNLGRVAAKGLVVSLSGDGVVSTPSSETVTLDPSTSKTINRNVMNLARIREDVIADQAHTVNASVGSTQQALNYTVSWAGTIEALVNLDPAGAASLKNFVIRNIEAEMVAAVQSKSKKFYKDGAASKLADLVALRNRTPEGHRAILAQIGTDLLNWEKKEEKGSLKGNKWKLGSLKEDFAAKCVALGGVRPAK